MSFLVIQEFEMLMQESIKKVINIHKCKLFFFKFYVNLRADSHGLRTYAGQATTGLRAHNPDPPHIFFTDLRAGLTGQALIVTPNFN